MLFVSLTLPLAVPALMGVLPTRMWPEPQGLLYVAYVPPYLLSVMFVCNSVYGLELLTMALGCTFTGT